MNNVWKYIKSYKQHSLLVFNFAIIFGVTVLMITSISLGFYYYYDSLVRDYIEDSNNAELQKMRDIIDMVAIDVDRLSLRISNDSEIIEFLKYKFPEEINYETVDKINKIRNIITFSNFSSDYIASIDIYSNLNDYLVSSLNSSGAMWKMNQMPELTEDENSRVWVKATMPHGPDGEARYITNFRRISLSSSENLGVVIINLDIEKLGTLIKAGRIKNYEEIYIIDENNILYSTIKEYIGKNTDNFELLSSPKKVDGKELFVTGIDSAYNRWRYISLVMPEEYYENKNSHLNRLLIISIVISIVVSFAGAVWISIKVFQPIGILMNIVQGESGEKVSVPIFKKNESNELKHIIGNIMNNYKSNYEMKQELLKRQILLEKAQIIALQAQINPHFMYNTLDNINWKVMEVAGGYNKATEMINILSNLLRSCLETADNVIPIEDEVRQAELYIEILKRRHDDAFEVIWNINRDILNCKIVKITLQPIIENAIYHGIMRSGEKGTVTINGYRLDEDIIIEVINEGLPVEDDILAELNKDMQSDDIKENSQIGIRNVNQRIKLIFGERYGLSIFKNVQGNTIVKIVLPKV